MVDIYINMMESFKGFNIINESVGPNQRRALGDKLDIDFEWSIASNINQNFLVLIIRDEDLKEGFNRKILKLEHFLSEKGSRQAAVRFDILLFLYKEQYGSGAMEKLIEEHGLLSGTENVITEEQIEHVYGVCGRKLKFIEQIELLSRKIYAYYKGLGAIDEIRDMKIDGVSGGVSGKRDVSQCMDFLSWQKCLAAVSGF